MEQLQIRLKEIGYNVKIRSKNNKTLVMWSNKSHMASAAFENNDKESYDLVVSRLRDTLLNAHFKIICRIQSPLNNLNP